MSNDPGEPNVAGGRTYAATNANVQVDNGALSKTTQQAAQLNNELSKMSQILSTLKTGFSAATTAASGFGQKTQSVTSTIGNLGSSMFGSANEKGWVQDFMMFPTRYMRSNITDNRQLALTSSGALGTQSFATGQGTQQMMAALAGGFGNVMGNPSDMLNMMRAASQVGAGVNWQNIATAGGTPGQWGGGGGPRMGGFFRSIYEMQRMNPMEEVGNLASTVGGYTSNVGAQQQAAFLTGGAFSMIGTGNQQKSVSQWSEGILKWLQNLRPGDKRGKPFSYGELMTQNYPGSNIDAWLTANGIPPDMKQYFWTYALGHATAVASGTADRLFTDNAAIRESVAYNRLSATNAQTRTGFQLAGQMSGAYANKEQANQWFAELTGHMLNQILPSAMSSGLLSYMQYLPDAIEEIMMQLAERTNLGTLGAGVVGWGSQFPEFLGAGDVGDVGDYGPLGGSSTAGMHPDARKRVDAMMRANPKLKMTSGFRDLGTQQRLKRKGVGRVSGRPSAHTRGMAADLGPPSQYGWLVNNAKKFGLRSGVGHGEPWHVGMGDIGDPLDMPGMIAKGQDVWNMGLSDTISSLFSGIFSGVTALAPGQSPEEQMGGIAGGISGIMKALMGIFTRGEVDRSRLIYRDVYNTMVAATNRAQGMPGLPTGTTSGGGSWWSNLLKNMGSGAVGGGAGGGGGGSGGPEGLMSGGGPVSRTSGFWREGSDPIPRGAEVVRLLKNAGFQGDELTRMAAIAFHESSWYPWSWVNDSDDIGGGLFAINQKPWLDQGKTPPYSKSQIQDPVMSAQIAREYFDDRGYQPWTTRNKSLDMGVQARNAAGVGDIGYYEDYAAPTPGGRTMVFQNTFNISAGGGNNGSIDVRRTVSMVANQLEAEMNRRMSRSN